METYDRVFEWWSVLTTEARIFYVVGIVAFVVGFFRAVVVIFRVSNIRANISEDVLSGRHRAGLISARSLVAFLIGAGVIGGAILESGKSIFWALAGGIVVGVLLALISLWAMKILYSARASGTVEVASAKGEFGEVSVAVLPNCASGGQVELRLGGRATMLPAISPKDEEIPAGVRVRVVKVIFPNILVVERAA
ncbi:MAG: hypothetical protein LUD39_02050 [Opitutae bacterium]|nr:hypothetical protein [Opitutae bacterium]